MLSHVVSNGLYLEKNTLKMPSFVEDPPKVVDEEYIRNEGSRCPFCNSTNILSVGYGGTGNDSEVECHDCGHEWLECYTITGILVTTEELPFL